MVQWVGLALAPALFVELRSRMQATGCGPPPKKKAFTECSLVSKSAHFQVISREDFRNC